MTSHVIMHTDLSSSTIYRNVAVLLPRANITVRIMWG